MKKLLFTTLICFGMLQLSAQTEKGNYLIGSNSNLGFSVQSNDGIEDNAFNLFLSVQGGYFVIDNLVAGINLGFSNSSQGDFSGNSFTIGPFARYYFDNVFFGAGFSFVNSNTDNGIDDFSINGSQVGLELGYAAFLNKNVAIEPAITFNNTGGDIGGVSAFALNIGFAIYL